MWDLCLALWGRLRVIVPEDEPDDGDSRPQRGPDSHEVTMLRREAVSEWLREVVRPSVREDVRSAKMRGGNSGNVDQVIYIMFVGLLFKQSFKMKGCMGYFHFLFIICTPSTTVIRQTAMATAQHEQDITLTRCSSKNCTHGYQHCPESFCCLVRLVHQETGEKLSSNQSQPVQALS